MPNTETHEEVISIGLKYLSEHDSVLRRLIRNHKTFTVAPHGEYYQELVSSIISQQLSVKAAAKIQERFLELFDGSFPTPEQILATPIDSLRSVGLSGSKTRYIKDLALHVQNGTLRFDNLEGLSNEAIIITLTAVKGIGVWTAQMFLLFCMGRLDVLPTGDLGIRKACMQLYNLPNLPDEDAIHGLSKMHSWHPYESIVSWYLWQSLDNA